MQREYLAAPHAGFECAFDDRPQVRTSRREEPFGFASVEPPGSGVFREPLYRRPFAVPEGIVRDKAAPLRSAPRKRRSEVLKSPIGAGRPVGFPRIAELFSGIRHDAVDGPPPEGQLGAHDDMGLQRRLSRH